MLSVAIFGKIIICTYVYSSMFYASNAAEELPPYVKQCRDDDPHLSDCILKAIDHLRPFLRTGIPDISLPAIEPFKMDTLSLALTSGPNGYRITLKDIDAFGASNFSLSKIKLKSGSAPFEIKIKIPSLNLHAKYVSHGMLLIIPATGEGTFHADLGDITAIARGNMGTSMKNGEEFFKLDKLDLDLDIKEVNMQVKKIFHNNRILIEATNLFLRENGHEVLKVMMPQLKVKLVNIFMDIINRLLNNIPSKQIYLRNAKKSSS